MNLYLIAGGVLGVCLIVALLLSRKRSYRSVTVEKNVAIKHYEQKRDVITEKQLKIDPVVTNATETAIESSGGGFNWMSIVVSFVTMIIAISIASQVIHQVTDSLNQSNDLQDKKAVEMMKLAMPLVVLVMLVMFVFVIMQTFRS